jgi:hypothetical protein
LRREFVCVHSMPRWAAWVFLGFVRGTRGQEFKKVGVWDEALVSVFEGARTFSQDGVSIASGTLFGPTRTPFDLFMETNYFKWEEVHAPDKLGWQSAMELQLDLNRIPPNALRLRTTLRVRGALVRSSTDALCRLGEPNLNKPRTCPPLGTPKFVAYTYFYWPSEVPLAVRAASDSNGLSMADSVLTPEQSKLFKEIHRDYVPLQRWLGRGSAQVRPKQHIRIFKAFLHAVNELPQPFTIIESGNFCGAVTVILARMKLHFCPKCRFITVDPTLQGQETKYKVYGHCTAKKTLDHFGLLDQVEVVETFAADLTPPGPIGFAYFDDGKIREAMAPQISFIEPYLMDGAYLAFDDYRQLHEMKGTEGVTAVRVADHAELMKELVSTGDYEYVARNEIGDAFGCIKRKNASSDWAKVDVELVDLRGDVSARATIAIRAPVDVGIVPRRGQLLEGNSNTSMQNS